MDQPTLQTIETLRTVHWTFDGRLVPDEDVRRIVEYGMHCANSDNLCDYSVIVVKDPQVLDSISGGESGGKAQTCLVYCYDYSRIIETARALGYSYLPDRSFYKLFIGMYDVMGAAQTAVIAAKAMGIDSLVTNFPHRNPKELRRLLKLPQEHCMPVIAVVLGYTDKPAARNTHRLSVDHILHFGEYQKKIRTEQIIREMDCIYPEYISEKYPHSLDWYYQEWMIDHYGPEHYQELIDDMRKAGVLPDR